MKWMSVITTGFLLFGAGTALAKPAGQKVSRQTARAIDELQGKFKWGSNVEDTKKVIDDEIHKKYAEDWKKAAGNPAAQDEITQKIREEMDRINKSYMDFKGQKTAWEVSIIDREFAHNNGEAMMLIEEGAHKQRRFLFFHDGRLYKQMIAFDKDLFEGKNFDQFAELIQNRYGRGIAKYKLNRKGDQVLEHLEWPPSGTTLLRAVDQSNFYDTFCLVIEDRHVSGAVASKHKESALGEGHSALVRDISTPEKIAGDANSDIVDRITGRAGAQGGEASPPPAKEAARVAEPASGEPARKLSAAPAEDEPPPAADGKKPAPAKKKGKGGKIDDLEL